MRRIYLVFALMLGFFAAGAIKVTPANAMPMATIASGLVTPAPVIEKTQFWWGGYYRPRYRYYRPYRYYHRVHYYHRYYRPYYHRHYRWHRRWHRRWW